MAVEHVFCGHIAEHRIEALGPSGQPGCELRETLLKANRCRRIRTAAPKRITATFRPRKHLHLLKHTAVADGLIKGSSGFANRALFALCQ